MSNCCGNCAFFDDNRDVEATYIGAIYASCDHTQKGYTDGKYPPPPIVWERDYCEGWAEIAGEDANGTRYDAVGWRALNEMENSVEWKR